jgi:hypothetical protein
MKKKKKNKKKKKKKKTKKESKLPSMQTTLYQKNHQNPSKRF